MYPRKMQSYENGKRIMSVFSAKVDRKCSRQVQLKTRVSE
jgi:hypothetical protein